jgi:hypothetical protein
MSCCICETWERRPPTKSGTGNTVPSQLLLFIAGMPYIEPVPPEGRCCVSNPGVVCKGSGSVLVCS